MNKTAMPKSMLQGKTYATWKGGRPRLKWLEDVHDDLRKMKVKGWGGLMKNREEWRQIDPVQTIPSYLRKIHFNIAHPPTSWSS
jgi:hypothetical protein